MVVLDRPGAGSSYRFLLQGSGNSLIRSIYTIIKYNISYIAMQVEDNNLQASIKMANSVEANCEYLTVIKSNLTNRTNITRISYSTLEAYLQEVKIKLNIESLFNLYIELAYFLYACKNQGMNPIIEPEEDLRIQEITVKNGEKKFMVVLWYKVSEEKIQQGKGIQTYNSIFEFIKEKLQVYLLAHKAILQKQQLEELQIFYRHYSQIRSHAIFQENESLFFLCLEQTNIFFEYSILYRIKNCSILDYIKTDENKLNKFRIAKSKDQTSVIEYNKEKSRNRNDQEVLRNKEKEIENNINVFFKSVNKDFFESPIKSDKDQIYRVKFYYIIREREKMAFQEVLQNIINGNFLKNDGKKMTQYKKRQLAELQFFIEYSSEKNHIGVKLYTPNICVNIQTSDFLMFQSNVLTFDAVNVSIELSQPRNRVQDKVSNKKVITFKSSSSFNIKEPPLEKILLLMDITMIASRIYEPQLNPNRYNSTFGKDYLKVSTISKKISHYTKLFMKCAKKVYSE